MHLTITECTSRPSGTLNEDRTGVCGPVAWVIDGATDVGDGPLAGATTDAAWIAGVIHNWLGRHAPTLGHDLAESLPAITADARARFAAAQRRAPVNRYEHPSAAGIIVRLRGASLDVLSLGDCTVLLDHGDGRVERLGTHHVDAPDITGAANPATTPEARGDNTSDTNWRSVLPRLRERRNMMNRADGYGVFSITDPPARFIDSDSRSVAHGTRLLLASDGYMRLVDMFGCYTEATLLDETFARGAAALLDELRAMETDAQLRRRIPRPKAHDDASVIAGIIVQNDQT